jgi:hypothetical protein
MKIHIYETPIDPINDFYIVAAISCKYDLHHITS